ncbi:MAG: electron transport complex subunit RsxC [Actinomycetota bacterium]|nr:electron transport complex subunit RsxC [Actinomycetota bacterium]
MKEQGLRTFKAGIHPPYLKELASGKAIKEAPVPEEVPILLQQHVGAPNEPLVGVGDHINLGQKIGSSEAFVSAPVHSSVAGVVKGIQEATNATGQKVKAVVVTPDSNQPQFSGVSRDIEALNAQDIVSIAKDAGLVGMGGAAFPTHVKLSPPKDKPIDIVIINACECEPFLTCDHRLLLERPEAIIAGLKLFMRAVGAEKGVIGIEANKLDALDGLRKAIGGSADIEIEVLEVKYPEGAEKQLIFAVTGRKVPLGKLPSEAGCLVQNVGTSIAMYEAAAFGKPLYERVITLSGPGIKETANLKVKIGTRISALIEACGGLTEDASKVIMGGPMTGWAQAELSVPVIKGTSGIVVLTESFVDVRDEHACVKCGKCVEVCPMSLMPNYIVTATQKGEWDKAEMWGALDCFECGCCSYTCPAYIPHVSYVRKAKAEIGAAKKAVKK